VRVGLGHRAHVTRAVDAGGDAAGGEVAGVGESDAALAQEPDADAALAARDHVLRGAVAHLDAGRPPFAEEHLTGRPGGADRRERPVDRRIVGELLAHRCTLP